MKKTNGLRLLLLLLVLNITQAIMARTFVHPGGLHTKADLDRMKAKVAAREHPWIDGWNALIADPQAQNTWNPSIRTNIGGGGNRQPASQDAHAAYLNTLRWYITGDVSYAECAVKICNSWANNVTEASGELFQLPINNLVQAAELLRIYPGWKAADFAKFKTMALTIFYPACHNFLGNCRLTSSWDSPAAASILGIGVLCDDSVKFKEGINYFKNGIGNGSIMKSICQPSGQVAEMGRDQPHASLGPAALAEMSQTAWNQGDTTLYSYANNRLLAGFEYFCKFNLNHPVDWVPYNDCDNDNWFYPALNGAFRIRTSPVYEMVYNHYAVMKGISAPYTQAMANVTRPELGDPDFFGYGTLTYTLDATASPYPPYAIPAAPTALVATPGISKIFLSWTAPPGDVSQGYNVFRSTSSGGVYTNIGTWNNNTTTQFTDASVVNGTTYYYKVSAINQRGSGPYSAVASTKPVAAGNLSIGWARKDIGSTVSIGDASYANVVNNTFIVSGGGADVGGTSDSYGYAYTRVTGDFTIIARLSDVAWSDASNKMGIVLRETLDANSKMLFQFLGDIGGRIAVLATRSETGGGTSWSVGNKFTWTPVWFKIQRKGNVFTGSQSTDGVTWFTVGTSTVAMANTYYAGLAVCAGGSPTGKLNTSTFDNVTTIGGGSLPSGPTNLAGVAMNSSRIKLTWTASPTASCYIVKRSMTDGGPYTTITTTATGTSYEDSGLAIDTNYYYVVKSANVTGESADSARIGVRTKTLSLPPAPTGLKVTSGNLRVTLSWNATEEFTSSYNVKRSTVSGGPYVTIAKQTAASYIDLTSKNDSTYYYVVSANNNLGEGANSTQVIAKPTIGQFSYFPFNETTGTTATDTWFVSRKATLLSGAAWAASRFNNGLRLDGTANGYATLPAGIVSSLKDFTVSLWIKLDAVDVFARAFDFGSGSNAYMFITPNAGYLRYAITASGNSNEQQINSTTTMVPGVWTHVAVTLLGNVGIMYVNGKEVGRNNAMTLTPSALGSTTQNYIGKSQFTDPMLKGTLDEFRIYKQALTPAQILQLKNALNQNITFDSIPQKKVGDADFAPGATASSGLALTYSSSNSSVATIVNGNIRIKGIGTANITASQAGDLSYVSALSVVRPLVVGPATGVETSVRENIVLYPNPVSDLLHLRLDDSFQSGALLRVYDSKGMLLISKTISEKETVLDVRALNPGVYFLKVSDGQRVVVNKFIKCN